MTQTAAQLRAAAEADAAARLEELGEIDRSNRSARTGAQVGIGGSVIIVVNWLTGFVSIDLDPKGPGTDMPGAVAAALTAIGGYSVARWMNRRRQPQVPAPLVDTEDPR